MIYVFVQFIDNLGEGFFCKKVIYKKKENMYYFIGGDSIKKMIDRGFIKSIDINKEVLK